jgi:hypothetical protein
VSQKQDRRQGEFATPSDSHELRATRLLAGIQDGDADLP